MQTQITTNLPDNLRIYSSEFIDNKIFYTTNKGVFICNLIDDTIEIEQHLLPNKQVSEVLKDTQGNVWFTTLGDGLYVLPNLNLKTNFKIGSNNRLNNLYKGNYDELFLISKKSNLYKLSTTTKKVETIPFKNVSEIKYFFYDFKIKIIL